jgi:DNA helicase-2/ATP-dependent DNA helicase PcrA
MSRFPEPILAFLGGEPTEEQWRAISYPLEPFVLMAGAGSGKTSVMAARIVHLAMVAHGLLEADHPGVPPGNVLCLTFTNKATELLRIRVRRALQQLQLPEGEEPEISNYHGFAADLLERYGMLIGLEPGQRVITPVQRAQIVERVLDQMTFEHLTTRWQPAIVRKILTLDEQLQNHLVEPAEAIAHVEGTLEALAKTRSKEPYGAALERIELAHAVERFRAIKAELGVIDFGDQIAHAVRIVREHPEVGAAYRERFQAVLLDEYQDTNHAQAELMAALFSGGHPVTAVGDPDQNIYAWRGASLYNLVQFPRVFPRSDGSPAELLPLYTNFRSGARILEAADGIISPLPEKQRPDRHKVLRPWPQNGQGRVTVGIYEHEIAEAEAIAERILRLHEQGLPWRGCAVLCRSHRLFGPLEVAFAARGIPAEFLGLAGLTRLPEIVEVLAYASAAIDADDSVALARILTGPRYRIGVADLARVADWTRRSDLALRRRIAEERLGVDEDLVEDQPHLIAEALEHLEEIEGLSPEGRRRLEAFAAELRELREAARRPVPEFLAEVVRRIGLLEELDAELDTALATAKRRNLAAFLDQVHAFQPVDGELTLRAFLDYLRQIEDDREWAPVQPSEEDSVKVMTVHAAKGLEFEAVFVPGLAKGIFPNDRVQHNPARRGESLDVELRRDRELLPTFEGNMSRFAAELKEQEEYEERRTAYVALTRAKQYLHVSAANWYGENLQNAKGIGKFLCELKTWGTGRPDVEIETAVSEDPAAGDPEAGNPLAGYRQALMPPWPGPALREDGDELFPQGWRRAAVSAADAGTVPEELLARLSPEERASFGSAALELRTLAAHLREREEMAEGEHQPPRTVTVSALIDYARCPQRFCWSVVRPLPRFSGPAARIGTEVHAWIERRSSGQASLLELEEAPDLVAEELAGEPGKVERLRRAFLESRFASMVPLYAERPFLLPIEDRYVGGRIDAIYGTFDGPWEVVDYKTGRPPAEDDALARAQLDLYALACIRVWGKRPEDLTLTYLYLATGQERSYGVDDPEAVAERVATWLRGIAASAYEPTPGEHCRWCDFRTFCPAGTAWVADH